jgi:hypothetical protein
MYVAEFEFLIPVVRRSSMYWDKIFTDYKALYSRNRILYCYLKLKSPCAKAPRHEGVWGNEDESPRIILDLGTEDE